MKMRKLVLAISLAGTVALTGCATTQGFTANKGELFKGAGIGCVVGGGLGALLGDKDDFLKGCATGAVVGGIASYQAQLNEAKEAERLAREAGMEATVKTREVQAEDGKTQAFDGLEIKYEPSDMRAMDSKTQATLDKLASLLSKSKNTLTVRFEGGTDCQIPLAQLHERGALDNHKVDNQCGMSTTHRILITPMPQV